MLTFTKIAEAVASLSHGIKREQRISQMTKTIRRRTQIDVETHEVTIIRTVGHRDQQYCQNCRSTVLAFAPERTAELLRIDMAEVFARVGKGDIHLTRTTRGTVFICGVSLNQGDGNSLIIKQKGA